MSDHKHHHESGGRGSSKYHKGSSSKSYSSSSKYQDYDDNKYSTKPTYSQSYDDGYYDTLPPKAEYSKGYNTKKRERSPKMNNYYKDSYKESRDSYKEKEAYSHPSKSYYKNSKSGGGSMSPYSKKPRDDYGPVPLSPPPKSLPYDSYSKSERDWVDKGAKKYSKYPPAPYETSSRGINEKSYHDGYYPESYKYEKETNFDNYDAYDKHNYNGRSSRNADRINTREMPPKPYDAGMYGENYNSYSAKYASNSYGESSNHKYDMVNDYDRGNASSGGGSAQLSRYVIGNSVVYGSPGHYPQGLLSRTPSPPPPPPRRQSSLSPPPRKTKYRKDSRSPFASKPMTPPRSSYSDSYGRKDNYAPLYPESSKPRRAYSPRPDDMPRRKNMDYDAPSKNSFSGKDYQRERLPKDSSRSAKQDFSQRRDNYSPLGREPSSQHLSRKRHDDLPSKKNTTGIKRSRSSSEKHRSSSRDRHNKSSSSKGFHRQERNDDRSNTAKKKPLLNTPPRTGLLGAKPPLLNTPVPVLPMGPPVPLMGISPASLTPNFNSSSGSRPGLLDGRLGIGPKNAQFGGRLGQRGGRPMNRPPGDLRGLIESRKEQSNNRRNQSSSDRPARRLGTRSDTRPTSSGANRNARVPTRPGDRATKLPSRQDKRPASIRSNLPPRSSRPVNKDATNRNDDRRPKNASGDRRPVGAAKREPLRGGRRASPNTAKKGRGVTTRVAANRTANAGGVKRNTILKKYQRLNVRKRVGGVTANRVTGRVPARRPAVSRNSSAKGKDDKYSNKNRSLQSDNSPRKYNSKTRRSPLPSNSSKQGRSPRRPRSMSRSPAGRRSPQTPSPKWNASSANSPSRRPSRSRSFTPQRASGRAPAKSLSPQSRPRPRTPPSGSRSSSGSSSSQSRSFSPRPSRTRNSKYSHSPSYPENKRGARGDNMMNSSPVLESNKRSRSPSSRRRRQLTRSPTTSPDANSPSLSP